MFWIGSMKTISVDESQASMRWSGADRRVIDCCGRTKCRLTRREGQEEKGAAVNQSRSESDRLKCRSNPT